MTLVEFNRIRSRVLKARKRGTLIKRNKAVDLVELYIEQLAKLKALKKSILANVKWKEGNEYYELWIIYFYLCCITCIWHHVSYFGHTNMSESEYNKKVKAAADAYLNHIITFDEWYEYMKKLIEEKENSSICGWTLPPISIYNIRKTTK